MDYKITRSVANKHMWDYLGRKLRDRNDVNSVRDLERALHEEWAQTPHFIRRLIS